MKGLPLKSLVGSYVPFLAAWLNDPSRVKLRMEVLQAYTTYNWASIAAQVGQPDHDEKQGHGLIKEYNDSGLGDLIDKPWFFVKILQGYAELYEDVLKAEQKRLRDAQRLDAIFDEGGDPHE